MIGSLFISTFSLALITSIVFAISPMIIVHNMGISVAIFALIEGSCEFIANIMKLVSGVMIDRWKRQKTFLLIGIALATISKPFIFIPHTISILFSKALERLSNGLTATPRDVIVTSCSTFETKGRNYGLVFTGKMLGCTLGPLFVGFTVSSGLPYFDHTYLAYLWIMVILGMFSFWVTWRYVPTVQGGSDASQIFQWRQAFSLNRAFWCLLGMAALFMGGRFADGMLLLHLKSQGYPEWLYFSTSGFFNAASSVSAWGVGKTLDSRWRKIVYVVVPLALVGANMSFWWGGPIFVPLMGMAFWGFQRSASQILFVSEISRIVPPHLLGTAIGTFYIVSGLCSFMAAGYGGYLAEHHPGSFFWVSSFFAVLSLLFWFTVRCKIQKWTPPEASQT